MHYGGVRVVYLCVRPFSLSLSFSVCVYLLVSTAWYTVPARLVVCDMMVGSVERIIGSSWLLGVLDQLRVLSLVVQRRQLSYNVTTQVRYNIICHSRHALLIAEI